MAVTPLSFFMSVLWSCIIISAVHFLRKKQFFLNGFGITTIVLLYVFCIGRMLFTFEFPFTRVIELPSVYNQFYQVVCRDTYSVGRREVNVFSIFLIVWLSVSVVLLLKYGIDYARSFKQIRDLSYVTDDRYGKTLAEIQSQTNRRKNICVVSCSAVGMPMGVGVFKKRILIPPGKYTDEEIRYVLLHEYTHFINRDLVTKLLIEIFCRLFWWNPLVYVLRKDVEQMMELRCDLMVISGLGSLKRACYLKTIKECLERSDQGGVKRLSTVSTQLFRRSKRNPELIERFALVAAPVKKDYRKFQIISIVCFISTLLCSYSFIFQPHYQPSQEEMAGDSQVSSFGDLSGYIVKKDDGKYYFINDNGSEWELKSESVEVFVSIGYEIREEIQ